MTLKVCQDPLNPRPGGGRPPPRTPNLAPMLSGHLRESERDFSHTKLILTSRDILLSPNYVSLFEFIAAVHQAGPVTF